MKIKTVQDVHAAADLIIGSLATQRQTTYFSLLVDHGDGTLSNLMFSCATPLPMKKGEMPQSFVAVDDYAKLMLLLLKHPQIQDLEYDEEKGLVGAVFICPEMQEMDRFEGGFEGEP